MKLTTLKIADIKPYWRNPRNNETAVKAVKESIKKYGYNSPIVVDKDRVIIAGHTRYKALLELGYTQISCVIADLTPEKAKEYRIADNSTAEFAEWDMDKLIQELREISDLDGFQDFFDDIDIDKLLKETAGVIGEEPRQISGVASAPFDATKQEIAETEKRLELQFEERSQDTQDGYLAVCCPHCAETFYINKNEIQ